MTHKKIRCYHCGQDVLVPSKAFSAVCPCCNRRVSVEDHVISATYTTSNIETCGSLVVAPTGNLQARLRVQNLQVQGRLKGNVAADGKVTLSQQANLCGDITAGSLEISDGAKLKGFCRIGPK